MRAARVVPAACLLAAASLVCGCGRTVRSLVGVTNQPPTITLSSARAPARDASSVAHEVTWTARDPDGRVDHFLVATDIRALGRPEAGWAATTERAQRVSLPRVALTAGAKTTFQTEPGFQLLAVRAVDDRGAVSAPAVRAFFGENVAPTVRITEPSLGALLSPIVGPKVWIYWEGSDLDGPNGRPAMYKYKLIPQTADGSFLAYVEDPDSLRRRYAPTFAGWDSVSGDSTRVHLTSLEVNRQYLFAITALDAQRAYDPVFSLDKNVLRMHVSAALGPRVTLFGDGFTFTYPSGGFSTDPLWTIHVSAPAEQPITVHWYANPSAGGRIAGYRWAVDIADVYDETPRRNANDLAHWSAWGPTTSAAFGPFRREALDVPHRFYVEAMDDNEVVSLGIVEYRFARQPHDQDLLIVNDTRFPVDMAVPGHSDSLRKPIGSWPTAAELDTFLFAVGGVRWRMTPAGTLSPLGIFHGYRFDTLGTRTGLEDPTIPLDVLGRYRHIVWINDGLGASYEPGIVGEPPSGSRLPQTTLRYMSDPNHMNTLAAWVRAGGQLWALGGGFGLATNGPWDRRANNVPGQIVFSSAGTSPDLGPGRFLYDLAHWRSEVRIAGPIPVEIARAPFPVGDLHGRPSYALLPARLASKAEAGDRLPPFRSPADFYTATERRFVEYLSQPNRIEESHAASDRAHLFSVLDTLMVATGLSLPAAGPDPGMDRIVNPVMTYYHGYENGPVMFSGFDLWSWSRADCARLVDAVLTGVWGLTRTAEVSAPPLPRTTATAATARRR